MQRAFRLRRAEHLASLEDRINQLESENSQLRALLSLPEAERTRIGSGPTGRGKALKEGGVPMSERVRARKEARARERAARGIPEPEDSDHHDSDSRTRDSQTLSPRAVSASGSKLPFVKPPSAKLEPNGSSSNDNSTLSLFQNNDDSNAPYNYNLPMSFNLPVESENSFPDFGNNMDSSLYKSAPTPGYGGIFGLFGDQQNPSPQQQTSTPPVHQRNQDGHTPISPPHSSQLAGSSNQGQSVQQPDLLTRLKGCCHLSDSHVVNDPGLLIFATRLCQSFPCGFNGSHPDPIAISDSDFLLLEDSWKALKSQLDPGGETDGENRINTGRMAAELVCRAAQSRNNSNVQHGNGAVGFIVCRYREGMSIRRSMIAQLVQGLGGSFE